MFMSKTAALKFWIGEENHTRNFLHGPIWQWRETIGNREVGRADAKTGLKPVHCESNTLDQFVLSQANDVTMVPTMTFYMDASV